MATTIHDMLTELFNAASDEHDKGTRFERLIASYLRTDVTWAERFSDVWLWSDWPGRAV